MIHRFVGLICLEDLLVQIDELGIEHGYDVDRMLWLGQKMEKTCGRRLRSEAVDQRPDGEGRESAVRPPGPQEARRESRREAGQRVPAEWPAEAKLGDKWGPTAAAWKK